MATIGERLRGLARELLGVSAYQEGDGFGAKLDDASVIALRKALGGNIQPLPTTRLRWYLKDLESAQAAADTGNLANIAQLQRAMRRDGELSGLMAARTAGLVRLPKQFFGDEEIANDLRRNNGSRPVFDEMCPPAELAMLGWDGIDAGVGVGELVPVSGRDYPVLTRLDPEYLQFRWSENRWYYASLAGLLPITPGDGRWVLHMPGGRLQPWQGALWPALGRAFINKEHALLNRSNYSAKLANPARVAEAPSGATQVERVGMLKRLIAWGTNTVFELPPGWKASILESNGRGTEVFQAEIDTCNREYMVAICGQEVTTTGGAGFSNADVHRMIREDLIQADGENLAYTVNTQILPAFIGLRYGAEAITGRWTSMQWNTARPKELEAVARAQAGVGTAISALDAALAPHGLQVAVAALLEAFGVPVQKRAPGATQGDPNALKEAA